MLKTNETIQWLGTIFVIIGHLLNSFGTMDPFNIVSFLIGLIFFLIWAINQKNTPQTIANVVGIAICIFGIYRAYNG